MQAALEYFRKELAETNRLLSIANTKVSKVLSQMGSLQVALLQERKKNKAKYCKIARLQEKLGLANKNFYQ